MPLSLLPKFFETAFEIRDSRMGVNYGLNKVRFTAPVPVGSRLRGRIKLLVCEPIDNQGTILTVGNVTFNGALTTSGLIRIGALANAEIGGRLIDVSSQYLGILTTGGNLRLFGSSREIIGLQSAESLTRRYT